MRINFKATAIVGITLLFAWATMGADSCSTESGDSADVADSATDGGANEEIPSAPAKPEPDGQYNLTCDYLLGDFTEGTDAGFKFVAGGTVKNTGNIGIVARARARWQQLGSAPLLEERTLRVAVGRTKRVAITRLGTQSEIDAHQSANGDCSTSVKIVDTFGKPR